MRRPIFVVMILLLLLRGLVGHAMAGSMAASQLQQAQSTSKLIANNIHPSSTGMHFDDKLKAQLSAPSSHSVSAPADCPGHASGDTEGALTPPACGHGDDCGACQACNTAALWAVAANATALAMPAALPGSPPARFASAVTALDQKPPIS